MHHSGHGVGFSNDEFASAPSGDEKLKKKYHLFSVVLIKSRLQYGNNGMLRFTPVALMTWKNSPDLIGTDTSCITNRAVMKPVANAISNEASTSVLYSEGDFARRLHQ